MGQGSEMGGVGVEPPRGRKAFHVLGELSVGLEWRARKAGEAAIPGRDTEREACRARGLPGQVPAPTSVLS